MTPTAWLIVAALLLVCVAAWMWLRGQKSRAPDDDQGATPRDLEDGE